ncbi:arsenical-resistance protein, partial [Fistulina hepatica ATCC 64428]
LWRSLSWTDRLLAPFVLIAMIVGIVIGVYAEDGFKRTFQNRASWNGVSIPILVGLLVMIWPALMKVQWERILDLMRLRSVWAHLGLAFVLNWIISPFVMLALAWATLPEDGLVDYRRGVLLVGVARCIAMILIWNSISCGDANFCAILVVFNSLLQVVLFAPYAVLFTNYLGVRSGANVSALHLDYSAAARAVGIYLGIPLAAGVLTRAVALTLFSPANSSRIFSAISPLSIIGLLYTIIVLFASQGKNIIDRIGTVFRVCVPLVLYFVIMWFGTFFTLWFVSRTRKGAFLGGYEKVVTQAFTAGSNNFELAIAVAIASFGTDSHEVLAATLGPLIEVPVLLSLSYVALWLKYRLRY